ncbi:relaxase/mobilization nuclease domain-containing protein [Methylobacterium radiotolerans]|uniref:relaxase/mobilization nuclease domain-containing protein n=1 Tax=Methylobacterium radiotolerans TaxID=31998 RepID=UPI0009783210|nr:relaxase/mobilization nuclease domain-containing protein [Methylobacterium radiotolerans]
MVKVTGRSRGGAGHLKAHLDYITRNGRLHAETQDGERITDRAALRALHDDWLLANAAEARGRPAPNAAQSVAIILSMPPGTPPDRVQAAARTWARETFAGTHDYLMVRHDDTKHPHVHVTVRAVGIDGKRLAPGPADLQLWRERFARELRRLGVEAEATPRQARGVVRKAARSAIQRTEQRGNVPRVRVAERREAERDARAPKPPQPRDWSRDIQARQEAIRRAYLSHAGELAQGDAADRRLATDIQRFVAEMPVPLTRRQALAVELRQVLDQHPGRAAPTRREGPHEAGEALHRAKPSPAPEPRQDGPTRPRRR